MTSRRADVESPRSWLFAPGHNERLLDKVFDAGADAAILDLEDSVPDSLKDAARRLVTEAINGRPCWVRVNRPRTDTCEHDIEALGGLVSGLRVPKVESVDDVAWVAARAPGILLDCTIESARGVMAVNEIAASDACTRLSFGNLDLATDLGAEAGDLELLYARSALVIASRAAAKPPPSDGVFTDLVDDGGLRHQAEAARRLGFFGKSALHPRQVPIINEVFTTPPERIDWAMRVLQAFEASGGAATRLPNGEFVDLPVAEQARKILRTAR